MPLHLTAMPIPYPSRARSLRLALLLGAAVVVAACPALTAPRASVHDMEIAPASITCVGMYERQCLLVRMDGDTEWVNFFESIKGFAYEPGYRYRLVVLARDVPNPPADGSSVAYRLLKLVSKVRE